FPAKRGDPFIPAVLTEETDVLNRLDGSHADATQDAQPSAPDHLSARLLAATVRIKIDDGGSQSVGSGTIIDSRSGEALVLTCGHIFRDSGGKRPITVDLFGTTPQE